MKGLCIPLEAEGFLSAETGAPAHFPHAGIERLFSGMPERRVTEIMGEGGRFRQFRSQAVMQQGLLDEQIVRDCAGNLRDFDAVCQPCAIEIRLADAEDLRFPLEPPECRAVQNPVPVSFSRMTMVLGGSWNFLISTL